MESNVAELPLSHKLWAWFETNRKPALYGVLVIVAVGLIVGFVLWHQGETRTKAGEALSNLAVGLSATGPRPSTAEDYLRLASEYPNSLAGSQALLLAGATYFTEGKYPQAQAQFERFAREYHESPFMGQALYGIASCLDAQGKADQAAAGYRDLITRHSTDPAVPAAKFALARIYESQNKPEQARDLYDEVARANPYGSMANEAGLRMEELSAKYPKLVPNTPVPTNAPFTIEKK
jgi:tetratricopeptide (TPR) repeat protein